MGSRPRWSSPTPISSGRRRPPRGACSPTPARTAAPAAECWCSAASSTATSICWPTRVEAWTVGDPTDPTSRWDRWSPRPTGGWSRASWPRGWASPGEGRSRPSPAGAVPDGPGFWFPPTVVAPADPGLAHGPRGDLRTGGGGHPLRGRGRRRASGQRHALRAVRLHLDRRRGPCPADGPGHPVGQPLGQLAQLGAGADQLRRDEAVGLRAGARPRGPGLLHRREERLRRPPTDEPTHCRTAVRPTWWP